ncbi:MAG: hypothetical protein ACPGVL_00415 [Pseudoalteromonas spongiae]|uniref:hypothetical protein n=1 Tax=Pseudoalteromonas sp. T1lg24 TaxID=2077099 RepID=UPI001319F6F2|nr:hypothetical protein [Pseudoalteromonas sp. T1lg24]
MKNYFLFVLVILILASVDHPSIAKPRQELYDKIMGVLSDSSKVKTDQEAARSLERAKEKLRLSQTAEDYLTKQLATNQKMSSFKTRYCVQKELNSYFYGDDLRQICKIIAEESKR